MAAFAPRRAALWAHRVVGLATSVFLLVAGCTGAGLAFLHEAEAALNPELFVAAPPSPATAPLDLGVLRERLERSLPAGARVANVPLAITPSETALFWVEGAHDDEYFVDPYTGEVRGARAWGDLSQGKKNLLPFVYRLHTSLALDEVGTTLLGVVALLWVFDTLVAAYLTLPAGRAAKGTRYLARWRSSWIVRAGERFATIFTWHRASGLWIFAPILVFAWSAVALNLREVYNPVTRAVLDLTEPSFRTLPALPAPRLQPALSFAEAEVRGRALLEEQGRAHGFTVEAPWRLGYDAARGAYRYQARSSLDVSDRYPYTVLWLDGDDGRFVALDRPTGGAAGTTLTTWLVQLHMGSVRGGGLALQLAVALCGILVAALSVTGVWISWRKLARHRARSARPLPSGAAEVLP